MSSSNSNPALISTVPELQAFHSSIPASSALYIDLEGNNLCRYGTISLITILVYPPNTVHLIDVQSLGGQAFTTSSPDGKSLKSIFEDATVSKCIWDVRNDADALWSLYNINLAGVTDIQLLENASRPDDRTYLRGLDKCVEHDLKLGFMETHRWLRTKKEIQSRMATNVFAARPLDEKTVQYCVNDVVHLPALHIFYLGRIKLDWLEKARLESTRRVTEAQAPEYEPQSEKKKLGPWGVGPEKRMTMDEMLDQIENDWMDAREEEMLDPYGWEYYDNDGCNAADGAFDPEAFDSCWDKGD